MPTRDLINQHHWFTWLKVNLSKVKQGFLYHIKHLTLVSPWACFIHKHTHLQQDGLWNRLGVTGHIQTLHTRTHRRGFVVSAGTSTQARSTFHVKLVEQPAVLQDTDILPDSSSQNLLTLSQQVIVPVAVLIPHFKSHDMPCRQILGAQVNDGAPVWVVVVVNDIRTPDQLPVEWHLHIAICGCGVVSPKISSPLDSYDDPCHALTGRAAVLVNSWVIVALADAGIPGVALDAGLTAVAAVPPQAFLQNVMANGRAQVLSDRVFSRQ